MIMEALRAAAHFRKLSGEALEQLAHLFEEQEYGAGVSVYEVGEPTDALYIVAQGTVVTFHCSPQAGDQPLSRLRSGDIVGEADFFDSERRSEAARTTEKSVLLRGSRKELLSFLEGEPLAALNLRLAAARNLTARSQVTLAAAQRRVVRHRVNQEVRLTDSERGSARATLIDLSTLGMSLRGAPDHWRHNDIVRYRLAWTDRRLGLAGRVAWREGEQVGIEFQDPAPGLQAELEETLRQMLCSVA